MTSQNLIRVLYSFPHKIGAARICHTAWQQVYGAASAGAEMTVFPGAVQLPLPPTVKVLPTLARGKLRIPYKALGTMHALALHDYLVSQRIKNLEGRIDVVHAWPSGSLKTLRAARELGIPTVLERPNSHTRFAYEVVGAECRRLGITPHHEFTYKPGTLEREEAEFAAADFLLCPSTFVQQTFIDKGFSRDRLLCHQYGFDQKVYFPDAKKDAKRQFTMLFVGVDQVRKGLHFALEAWQKCTAHRSGKFLIAGELTYEFRKRFSQYLQLPSVVVLGHRRDVPELMRNADILILPTIEEGSPLVCAEAIGSGCVPVASKVCEGVCTHMRNSLIHNTGDVDTLAEHITVLHEDRELLRRLRDEAIRGIPNLTWEAAGERLLQCYKQAIWLYANVKASQATVV